MRQRIKPGEFLDFLSPAELQEHLERHSDFLLTSLGKNAQFKRVVQSWQDQTEPYMSPPNGFMWSIMAGNAAYTGTGPTLTNAYINDPTGMALNLWFSMNFTNTGMTTFTKNAFVLHSNDQLFMLPGTGSYSSGSLLSVILNVIEVPNSHEAQLLM